MRSMLVLLLQGPLSICKLSSGIASVLPLSLVLGALWLFLHLLSDGLDLEYQEEECVGSSAGNILCLGALRQFLGKVSSTATPHLGARISSSSACRLGVRFEAIASFFLS